MNIKIKKLLSRFGMGRGKKLLISEYLNLGHSIEKLHLGCGNIYINGWCNVDVIKTGSTDLVLDIASLPGIKPDSIKQIYSCHSLEHFSTKDIPVILKRWYEVLNRGGALRISVPDLDAITRIYQNNLSHFQVRGNQPWIALFYGGQKDSYDFHKTGFNFQYLKNLLEDIGFVNIARYPNDPHFIDGLIDNSMASAPFGEFISVNVIAFKK